MTRGQLLRRLVSISLVAIAATACGPTSENPVEGVALPEAMTMDVMGDWSLRSMGGQAVTGRLDVSIKRAADGSIVLTYSDGAKSRTTTGLMSRIGDSFVASVRAEGGLWNICALSLDASRDQLTVRTLDTNVVREKVSTGTLRGTVVKGMSGQDLVQLKALPNDLRAFLEATPQAFSTTSAAVLVRRRGA